MKIVIFTGMKIRCMLHGHVFVMPVVTENVMIIKCIISILRSSTGVVNLYEKETCLSSFEPKPLRAIMNLTTSCTSTKFNSSSEILAIASDQADKAVKLVGLS